MDSTICTAFSQPEETHNSAAKLPEQQASEGQARHTRDLSQKLGRQPTLEEISDLVDQKPEELRQLIHYARLPISLDKPVGEDGNSELLNFIENENAVLPFNSVEQHLLEEDIGHALGELSEREASIIKLRFGLEGNRNHTLKV